MATETLTAPLTPGIQGVKWVVQEFTGGLAEVHGDVAPDVPELLRPKIGIDGFKTAGLFAQIGTPYFEMSRPGGLSKEERREARARSAHMMAYVGIVGKAVAESGRQEDVTGFLESARTVLTRGTRLDDAADPYKAAVLDYGEILHRRLGFSGEAALWQAVINELFTQLNTHLLDQLAESLPGSRSPERLLEIAVMAGAKCAEMAAIVASKPEDVVNFTRFLHAARAFGGVGFLEDQATNIKTGRMETYTSAQIRRHGDLSPKGIRQGVRAAREMRKEAEADLIHTGMWTLRAGRERKIYGSQLWFARHVYQFQRFVGRLSGGNKRIARQLQSGNFS